ncbi:MAG: hypothetical protein PHF56_00910 [Desulfuromonadaceae bacterium]|nr:hypothetical protein [Desulfuromonadaceae bacterium]
MKRIAVPLIYVVALLLLIWSVSSDLSYWRLQSGYAAFQRGDLDGAFSAWSSAGNQQEAVYNRAVIQARKGRGDSAAQLFIESAAGTDPAIRQRSLYNHGTLLLQQGMGVMAVNQEKARESFALADIQLSAAVTLDPRDSDALHNAEVARDSLAQVNALIAAKRGDQKKVPEQPETAKKSAEKGKQTDKPGKAGAETDSGEGKGKARSAPELSRSDAERLLNDARGREALRSATAARTKTGAVSPPEKEW